MPAKKILVIEDDKEAARMMELRLRSEGFKVDRASNGKDGLDRIEDEKPDLILLDVMMPILDGHNVCKIIKNTKKTSDIPVIMLTVKNAVGDVDRGFEAGADFYLNKPFEWDRLMKTINRALRLK